MVILTSSKEQIDLINGYLRKPVNFNQFAETVRQLDLCWFVLIESVPSVHKD
jgi:hypothetical protein